jgi:hypothetical protein
LQLRALNLSSCRARLSLQGFRQPLLRRLGERRSVARKYVDEWAKQHPDVVKHSVASNPATPNPKAADLAVVFFETFSAEHPGQFPSSVTHTGSDGNRLSTIEPVKDGGDVQPIFFDMWRQDHPNVALQDVPGDFVTTSARDLTRTSRWRMQPTNSIAWRWRGRKIRSVLRPRSAPTSPHCRVSKQLYRLAVWSANF